MSKLTYRRRSAAAGALLFAPYGILFVIFGVVPVVQSAITSFRPSSTNEAGGFRNYLLVIGDFRFLPAALNVLTFICIFVPAMMLIVTAMALLLDAYQSRWNLSLRFAYIVPAAISGSVAVLVWYFMLDPTLSPFAPALKALGITSSAELWTGGNLAWIFALMAFATGAGNWIVVQYGSLQSVPAELVEAARLDGCNVVQVALRVKLPLISKYVIYMGVLSFAAAVQVFVEPQLVTSSVFRGAATAWSLNQFSYDLAFRSSNFPSSAALSIVLLIICAAGALVLIFRTNFFEREVRS